ncbi:hypothetical protein [Roseicyclus mahoneyensis]|uniref:Lipoprotein n=1 Tax=Roseicyclus mahoneyensis TaxID=164332 RepID=A0A316GPL9_9RHOB|nr:hypothetical protein [Roseicyclus mahoneyensis]PWK62834.1 hypothetical protein C7455_101871 [Roseicyclus mahoneyensis]
MTRSLNFLSCLVLAACVGSDLPPEVRRDVPGFLFCTPEGVSPLAATLVGRPTAEARPYIEAAAAAGVLFDIPIVTPDGSTAALAIETPDIIRANRQGDLITSIGCIPRDVCTGVQRDWSGLCVGQRR